MKSALLAALLACTPAICLANGSKWQGTTPVYQDEGNVPIAFDTVCSSSVWTVLVASDSIRRSVLFQALPTNSVNVCITPSSSTSAPSCGDTTPGIELTPNASLTDYTVAKWWCMARTVATGASIVIKGYWTRDYGDYGNISNPTRP